MYLALDAHNHPFILHYQTVLLTIMGIYYRPITFHSAFLQRTYPNPLTTQINLFTIGAFPTSLAATIGIIVIFFSSP